MTDPKRPRRVPALTAVWLFAIVTPAAGQETPSTGPRNHAITRATSDIVVDARLDEAAWADATLIDLPFEIRPGENTPAPARTEMRVTYDDRHLYVGFRAFDPDPSTIRARLSDRDRAFRDDIVGITIDTFNDERRAFEFWSNPLGVQMDLVFDDVSGNEDDSWDAIWDSAGRLTEDGFEVEMAIPFSSLRFPKTSGPQTWGFDAIRFWPRDRDYTFRSQPRDRDRSCYVCQFSKMTGFEGISPGRNIEINPTVVANSTERRDDLLASDFQGGDVDSEFGLTARWGVTPNLTFDVTVNPDFSQVEADTAQLEVNNQFALFFPEKRPFFLEGADFFSTPFNAVHTRVIANPDVGLKLTGKQGPHAIGVFTARDTGTSILFPGSQGSSLGFLDEENDIGVVRYRRDIGEQSALGVLVTSREGEGRYRNQVAGLDGLIRFSDADSVSFQGLFSRTRYPQALVEDFDQPAGELEDSAYRVSYRHNSREWSGYATYEWIGDDFRADLGFMPQVDRRFWVAGLERLWWGEEEDWWTRLWAGADYDVTTDQSGQELEREAEIWGSVSGPLQSFANIRLGRRTRFFNGREFEESFRQIWLEAQPNAVFSFGVFIRRGDQIDFANTQPGEQFLVEPEVRFNLGRRVRLDLSHTFNELDVEAGNLFTANLSELRLVYQFNRRTFVRLISQYLDIERDPALFSRTVEARAQDLLNELLFSYKLNPRTVLFLGYSDNHQADDRVDLRQRSRALFLKIGYAWVL